MSKYSRNKRSAMREERIYNEAANYREKEIALFHYRIEEEQKKENPDQIYIEMLRRAISERM